MSTNATYTLNHTSSPDNEVLTVTMMDLRRTESLDTLPDISANTLSRDKRELSAWYRARDTPPTQNERETAQSVPHSDPSLSDEKDVSPTPSNSPTHVRCISLSPASTLTSLESDAETDSSDLTSLDSDIDDDSPMAIYPTSDRLPTSDNISQTTPASPSRPARKRKRSGCRPARYSKRLVAKRRKVSPS